MGKEGKKQRNKTLDEKKQCTMQQHVATVRQGEIDGISFLSTTLHPVLFEKRTFESALVSQRMRGFNHRPSQPVPWEETGTNE